MICTSDTDDGICSTCLTEESQKHHLSRFCHDNKSQNLEMHTDSNRKLEIIWRKALDKCQSSTLRSFLQKEGRVSSICVNQGKFIMRFIYFHFHIAPNIWDVNVNNYELLLVAH